MSRGSSSGNDELTCVGVDIGTHGRVAVGFVEAHDIRRAVRQGLELGEALSVLPSSVTVTPQHGHSAYAGSRVTGRSRRPI